MKKQTLIADIYTDQPLNIPEKGEKIGDLKINYPDYNVIVNFDVSKTKVNTYKVVSKPIVVATITNLAPMSQLEVDATGDKLSEKTGNEYHVLVISKIGDPNIEIATFTEADQTPIDYEGLEKIINKSLK